MEDIRQLGTDENGRKLYGYEVEFDIVSENWSEYKLADGTKVRIKNILLRVYRLVDENNQPMNNELGEPKVLINGNLNIVTSRVKSKGKTKK